jgi:thymidylate kinase
MPAPDLVILLDAPGETLFARKGEHSADFLEQQRQSYLKLQNKIPHLLVIDATRDFERVCRQITSLIWRGYIGRQAGVAISQFIKISRREGIQI